MKEIQYLGIKGTGEIDARYGVEHTASFSIFECPGCSKQYEIKTSRGRKQKTCKDCRGTQLETHKMSAHRIYPVWQGILQRCNNPKHPSYRNYGGKGITVDSKWTTFEGFWADMRESYQDGLTIDRTDSSKGYCKENCTWMGHGENSSKTSRRREVVQLRKVLLPVKGFVEVQVWESAKQAADTLGLVPAHITAVCQSKRATHGGFGWAYKEVSED